MAESLESGPVRTAEERRIDEAREGVAWRRWGPYLSERQWGTVREDYSADGDAWSYFTHDQARSRAYHWGEDGIAGICDDRQRLCFALALWNGKDPILKERLFGLTNGEGNHGEDVKEYYFYLDNAPTHSYMKYLYKYPQREYPYSDLVKTNRRRGRNDPEYELLDTGVFDDDRYFDVFIEYAKTAADDILIKISAANRGPAAAELHVLPTLWFRNTWAWWPEPPKPALRAFPAPAGIAAVAASHAELGDHFLYCAARPPLLFTENETNNERLFGAPNATPYVKDAFHNYLIAGQPNAVNPHQTGTKAAAHYQLKVPAGGAESIRLRLADAAITAPFDGFDKILEARRAEADGFYRAVTPPGIGQDAANVVRQSCSGLLWGKQYFFLDANKWLAEHDAGPMRPANRPTRNREWFHMLSSDIFSMPDKWEYPWFAAWDLAFHALALGMIDIDLAKQQLDLLLDQVYLHPTGQIPAYEWNFSDVNPPVHAWATIFLYRIEQAFHGRSDFGFLKRVFGKLTANFGWWVNRKDRFGNNLYEGGFLGLDNIGVFDRSAPLPTGWYLE
ncbi:MAG: MGH1-like glycoside hydrolase domain-containing protein, partial [Stellaceae bacterium]